MNTAAKVVIVLVALYLAYWIFRSFIVGILSFCFWLIRGIVFLAVIVALLHLMLKVFCGFNLFSFIKALWR